MRVSLYITVFLCVISIVGMLTYVGHPIGKPILSTLHKLNFLNSINLIYGVSDVTARDHIRGDKKSNVVLLEYSDYTCYYCGQTRPALDRLIEEYPKLLLVYRHYIPYLKRSAVDVAVAAECVAEIAGEDVFWEYTNLLYKNQSDFAEKELVKHAISLGISSLEIRTCLENADEIRENVSDKSQEIQDLGAIGTPFILITIDGITNKFVYSQTYEELIVTLKEVLGDEKFATFAKKN